MLQWLRKKQPNQPHVSHELLLLVKKVTAAHLCAFLCFCLLGGYKPALLITSGKGGFRADFFGNSPTTSADTQAKNPAKVAAKTPVSTAPVKTKPEQTAPVKTAKIEKKEPAALPAQTTKLYPPITPLTSKKSEPIKQKETIKIPVVVAAKKTEKQLPPEPEPAKTPKLQQEKKIEAKPAPVQEQLPQVQERAPEINCEQLDMGTINQQSNQNSALEAPIGGWQEHPIARIIAEQWHTAKGMPIDFYCEILFIINKQGKASEITVLSAHKSRIYQAHAQETLMRCTFDKKYSNKKCRIMLRI